LSNVDVAAGSATGASHTCGTSNEQYGTDELVDSDDDDDDDRLTGKT